jgi:hypothetical protein
MFTRLMRLPLALALLLATFVTLALPRTAAADERGPDLRPGVYEGIWHTDKAKVIVEDVYPDGQFTGLVHLDPSSRWPNYCFLFNGQIGPRGKLTLTRVGDNCTQIARTDAPCREGRAIVWRGDVAGDGLDRPLPFEMRIPLGR